MRTYSQINDVDVIFLARYTSVLPLLCQIKPQEATKKPKAGKAICHRIVGRFSRDFAEGKV